MNWIEVRAEKTRVSKTSTDGPRRNGGDRLLRSSQPGFFLRATRQILMNHLFSRHAQWVNVRAWIVIPQGKDVPGPRVTARREKSSVLWVLTMAFATDPRGTLSLRALAIRSLRIYRTRKTNFFRTGTYNGVVISERTDSSLSGLSRYANLPNDINARSNVGRIIFQKLNETILI